MTTIPTIAPCPDCEAQRVGAPMFDAGGIGREGRIGVSHVTNVRALVCTGCGRVFMYVTDLDAFRRAMTRHPNGFTY